MQFKSVFIALLGFMPVLFSCKKTSTETLDEMISIESMLKSNGSFTGNGSAKVTAQAKIYLTNNKHMLKLENFGTTNGPDLKVYLSKAASPRNLFLLAI